LKGIPLCRELLVAGIDFRDGAQHRTPMAAVRMLQHHGLEGVNDRQDFCP
jgi:hypothetical protein